VVEGCRQVVVAACMVAVHCCSWVWDFLHSWELADYCFDLLADSCCMGYLWVESWEVVAHCVVADREYLLNFPLVQIIIEL